MSVLMQLTKDLILVLPAQVCKLSTVCLALWYCVSPPLPQACQTRTHESRMFLYEHTQHHTQNNASLLFAKFIVFLVFTIIIFLVLSL